jgi:sugar O-acyltransferase (sialic acid O-acetyltransferase NeuD family)
MRGAAGRQDIVIRGAGGYAKEVAVLIEQINERGGGSWNLLGFIDADQSRVGSLHGKYPVLGDHSYLQERGGELAVALAIGTPHLNAAVAAELLAIPGLRFPALVHPSVVRDPESVWLADGVVVCAGCILTTDISIGPFTMLNLGVTVGHDSFLGANCILNHRVALGGTTRIGDRCLLGSGAVVLQGLTLGPDAVVGAGAVVIDDVAAGVTVVGVPAKPTTASVPAAEPR